MMQGTLTQEYSIPKDSILLLNKGDAENKPTLFGGGMFYKEVLTWIESEDKNLHYAIFPYFDNTAGMSSISKEDLITLCKELLNSDRDFLPEEIETLLKMQKIASNPDSLSTGVFIYDFA
jgi:hypothetical protein